MSHIPPHKRQTKGYPSLNPTPAPESVMRYVFDKRNFQTLSPESFATKEGLHSLSLVSAHQGCSEGTKNELIETPWLLIAANVKKDLLLSFQHMKREMDEADMAQVKPSVVARFGKVLFYGTTVSCKCPMAKDHNKIQLYKIELNRVRHMVANTSIRGKSSDLRLFVYTKKIKLALSDEEKNEIKDLIGSVILDSQVPGGLRWPLDKRHSPGGRYVVNSIGYTTAKSYMNSSIRFKFRHANRYKFESSTGEEVTQEIFMKMPGIVSELRKQTMDEDLVFEMLKDNLKLIWDLSV
ncbi:uncharacterized protein [Solanum lycopersicum]|uniref:uncharacterized protein n=1 Tax=Solanum lycopersicum TaxID=4081 RepID=UPI003748DB06